MRGAVIFIVLGAIGCSRKSGAPDASVDPSIDWQSKSSNGVAVLTSHLDGTSCTVSCGQGGLPFWQRTECIATREDLRFVSKDCSVVLVLLEAPTAKEDVGATVVGMVWRPSGAPTPIRLDRIAPGLGLTASNQWRASPPRYELEGQAVGFDTLDAAHRVLNFDELATWVDRPPEVAVADAAVEVPVDAPLVAAAGVDAGLDAGLVEPPVAATDSGVALDKCETARKKLSELERALAELKPPAECELEAVRLQSGTQMFGAEERLKCRTTREQRVKDYESKKAALETERAAAQEELRRAQVGGC